MVYILPMPTYPHIDQYYADKQRLIDFGGSDNEQSIRAAFQNCLASYCRSHRENLELVPELRAPGSIIPDGTVKDSMRLSHGYWEAKDLHDNLDAEIQNKLNRGYPNDNILFENSRTAVLIQRGTVARRADMRDPGQLHRLVQSFLNFITREVEEFRQAWQQFKKDLPDILEALREAIRRAAERGDYQTAAAGFLELCHRTIGPDVSEENVQEMLIQHILTKDIFLRVFSEDQYHQENNIARQLDALAQTFFIGTLRRDTTEDLLPYYGAITGAAANIADYREKQRFLKTIYEDFYRTYNPAAADRLGVVYTPDEIVDFIIRGADHLLQLHFGRSLSDDNVQILDPATGTGTFITSLIDYLPEDRLEYKYLNEIHANEVAILPYYIANLNIEYSYKEKTGRYLEFPNLCFVDTLDNLGWQESGTTGGAVQRQGGLLLGGLSEENWIRVQEQNEKSISVIIGNPPYNANQQNWNDFNPNIIYPDVDQRIGETYIAASTAQKTKQYDMYKRFIRWASDRLADDGIIAFVTNRAYLDKMQDDGFRKVMLGEFSNLYVLDLGGDVREYKGVGNVFGIMTGVAIGFFVRQTTSKGMAKIHYYAIDDKKSRFEKLTELQSLSIGEIDFRDVVPDNKNNWLNQSNSEFESLMPLFNRESKSSKSVAGGQAVFGLHALGVSTNRDGWVYDFDMGSLRDKALFFSDNYNALLDAGAESYDPVIKWSRDLRNEFKRGRRIVYNDGNRLRTLYRPFVHKHHFTDFTMNDVLTGNHYEMFGVDLKQPNSVICFQATGARRPFSVLGTNKITDLHLFFDGTQCLPRYCYTPEGERVSNITEWGLRQFRERYGDDSISAEDIFAYTYGVLHDPVYREKYAVDLLREFPRLPFYPEFQNWVNMGQELLDLHIGFESAEPYPLKRVDQAGPAKRVILRADKERGVIVLDDVTSLAGVPPDAWRYRLGSRSALEWVLDQYKERKPRDPTIAEKFNTYRFADYKERVIDLLQRVCAVSVGTMDVVDDMAYWDDEGRLVVYGDRDELEWSMLGLAAWAASEEEDGEGEDEEWLEGWLET